MKKIVALFLAACLLLTLAACDAEPKTETRYVMATQIYEMPDNGIRRETAFHYTGEGKIESMVITENGGEVGRVEYVMNEDGMVWKQIATEGGVASITEYAYTLDDAGNPIRTEQTVDGAPYSVNEYAYDKDGNLLTAKTTNDRLGMTSTITYTPSGDILKQEYDYGEGRVYTTEFTYDDGKLMSAVTSDAAGQRETRYEYDGQGREVKSTEYLADGTVNQYSETTYEGLTETKRSYKGDGTALSYAIITRDEHGNTLVQEHYDQENELMFRQSFTWLAIEEIVD